MIMHRPEQDIHRAVARYLDLQAGASGFWWCHVPNGGARTKAEGAIFKALGIKAGTADVLIIARGGLAHWIELKAGAGRLSGNQAAFRDSMGTLGAPFAICQGVDEVQATLRAWGIVR